MMRVLLGIACLSLAGCGFDSGAGGAGPAPATQPIADTQARASRHFEVVSIAELPKPSDGGRLEMWMPVPSSDAQQTIANVRVETSLAYDFQIDPDYGNRILHAWSDRAEAGTTITLRFDCTRREEHALPAGRSANVSSTPAPDDRLLQPDRLGVIDDRVRAIAWRVTAGKTDALSKAHAIYDYAIDHMAYDKVTPGWGNGDTRRACEIGKGNCTDFSALFISLARAAGIPARFKMGCQIPPTQHGGPIIGYHCWAEFWAPGIGWVPVDASEAWKDPFRRDFYFGSLDPDRIQFSLGRDERLPGMHGDPLNYFFAPYAEIDGKAMKVERLLSVIAGEARRLGLSLCPLEYRAKVQCRATPWAANCASGQSPVLSHISQSGDSSPGTPSPNRSGDPRLQSRQRARSAADSINLFAADHLDDGTGVLRPAVADMALQTGGGDSGGPHRPRSIGHPRGPAGAESGADHRDLSGGKD